MSASSLKMIYHAFFHLAMSYGIIFWGNSSHSSTVFSMQKKAIRIMEGCGNRVSCGNLFNYNFFFDIYVIFINACSSKQKLLFNNENHNLDTRQRNNLYLPQSNLTIYI